ncbi:hypothetical protein BKA62DRAFT_670632 [Auriculariales sp. MPI-PUGE-AT-0066]|nr:hypothetical protein BKA62DRAFT_670632 [Auriculariales sp. MPI-PUGE-AT-0066]
MPACGCNYQFDCRSRGPASLSYVARNICKVDRLAIELMLSRPKSHLLGQGAVRLEFPSKSFQVTVVAYRSTKGNNIVRTASRICVLQEDGRRRLSWLICYSRRRVTSPADEHYRVKVSFARHALRDWPRGERGVFVRDLRDARWNLGVVAREEARVAHCGRRLQKEAEATKINSVPAGTGASTSRCRPPPVLLMISFTLARSPQRNPRAKSAPVDPVSRSTMMSALGSSADPVHGVRISGRSVVDRRSQIDTAIPIGLLKPAFVTILERKCTRAEITTRYTLGHPRGLTSLGSQVSSRKSRPKAGGYICDKKVRGSLAITPSALRWPRSQIIRFLAPRHFVQRATSGYCQARLRPRLFVGSTLCHRCLARRPLVASSNIRRQPTPSRHSTQHEFTSSARRISVSLDLSTLWGILNQLADSRGLGNLYKLATCVAQTYLHTHSRPMHSLEVTSPMQKLPAELLAEVMLLVDPYCVPMKFALSRVCSYWRAVALNTRALWSTFEIDSTNSVRALPYLLVLSAHGAHPENAPLGIRLTFGCLDGGGDRRPHLMPASRDAAIALLAQPDISPRIASLEVTYNTPGALRLLIGSDLYFPRLERLDVCRGLNASTENVRIMVDAPRLRHLRLFRSAPRSWDALLVRSLEDILIEHCGPDAHVGVLATVFRRCPGLIKLALYTYDNAPLGITRDVWLPQSRSGKSPGAGSTEGARIATATASYDSDDDDDEDQPPLQRLDSLRLEATVPTDAQNSNQLLASMADASIVPRSIWTCVKTGFFVPTTAGLLNSVLRGLAPLRTLTLETVRHLTLGDEDGRERQIRVWDPYGAWEMPNVWRFLAKEYNAHRAIQKFVINTYAWAALADALAVVPPGSNPPGCTCLVQESTDSTGAELVVRPHYNLIARGAPSAEDELSPRSRIEPQHELFNVDALSEDYDEDPLGAAQISDALIEPEEEHLSRTWTTQMLIIPKLRRVKIEVTWAVSYAQQRRGVLRVLQWIQPRQRATIPDPVSPPGSSSREPSRSNSPCSMHSHEHTSSATSQNSASYCTAPDSFPEPAFQPTEVCVAWVEQLYLVDTRAKELRRLAAQLEHDGRGFTLCEHCAWSAAKESF